MKPRHRLSSRLWGTFEANSITEVWERPRRSARASDTLVTRSAASDNVVCFSVFERENSIVESDRELPPCPAGAVPMMERCWE